MIKIILLLLSMSSFIYSQELNCKVIVNYESLPVVNRETLVSFASTIEDYLNKTRFTDDWKYDKINCTFNIFVLSASSEVNYTAQAVISAQRPIYKSINNSLILSVNDNTWSFVYEKNQPLYYNQTIFDPLTSFLDYYANIVMGFYVESWEEYGGSPYFAEAFDIVNLGASSRFPGGWEKNSSSYSRRGLVEDINNDKYRPFRLAYYDYYYGIDVFPQKPEEGTEYILKLVNNLDDLRKKVDLNSVLIKVFFDAKHGEIIDYLKAHPDKEEIFKKLKKIDPAHASKYDTAMG